MNDTQVTTEPQEHSEPMVTHAPGFNPDNGPADSITNLNYCQVCGEWLGVDDYDGICSECDDAICTECCGEGELVAFWEMPIDPGRERTYPCPRCNGTGKELVEQEQP